MSAWAVVALCVGLVVVSCAVTVVLGLRWISRRVERVVRNQNR